MKKRKIILTIALDVLLVGASVAIGVVCDYFSPILTVYLNTIGGTESKTQNYSSFETDEELQSARDEVSYNIMGEGATLLRNENNTLPLQKGNNVSIFGQHAHEILASGSGSGSIGDPIKNLKEVLEDSGFNVNEKLWDFYLNNNGKSLGNGPALAGGNSKTDWSINEYPVASYDSSLDSTYSSYNDAAIVVISRTGGEGGDLATDMSSYGGSSNEHYLELSTEEKDLLTYVKGKFNKTIVLLNINNPLELGFLEEYNIDACLYIGGVGMSGLSAVGDILNGTINPSGHLNDTYVYDNFSSPASQNFGDFSYSNNDKYNYVDYAEGIYVGYRYYETRYADKIMNFENVGDYNYDETVVYPFGYGLSYTKFEWSNFTSNYVEESDTFEFSIDVKNVGDAKGKDLVEVYLNAPYDQGSTTIEKSFVKLVGFKKTDEIEPSETKTVTISVPKKELASYDYLNYKTYVVESGEYNLALSSNAHEASNEILSKFGYDIETDKNFIYSYTQSELDTTSYSKDDATNEDITNLFDSAIYDDYEVLSRKNWSVVEKGLKRSLTLNDKDQIQADKTGAEASLNPTWDEEVTSTTTNNEKDVSLIDYVGKDYDDESWNDIVECLKTSELKSLFSTAGYQTKGIESIDKPATVDTDGPAGLQSFVGGASSIKAHGYPTESLLACTYNPDLAYKLGEIVGEDALHGNVNGWYAPGMDIHRTPFGGRSFEYYSEDGLLSGKIGAQVVKGSKSKGLYCYIKHFALNEQDTNRGTTLHTWCNEQAMREIYLKPFEISVKEGNADALMTSLNCIGVTAAVGNYNLVTKLLKDEWGFEGMVITDYLGFDNDLMMQTLYAGGDAMLSTYGKFNETSKKTVKELQRACKNILYTVANSNAMYGLESGEVKNGIPIYLILEICILCLIGVGFVLLNLLVFKPWKLIKKNKEENN